MSVSNVQAQLEKRIRNLFRTTSRGDTSELREGLVSQFAFERKEAIERTIHAMTLGKDVSWLFPDILKNIATHDLDQKKLVYLYLMNYAKTHPELVILAVNTFVQDSEDPNPLVRALAIRTMGCIRVDKMVDFLPISLEKTLKDENPYVRKTAAITVAKLFDLDPELCVERGFVDQLRSLLDDSNPMVIANAVAALEEIQRRDPSTNAFEITGATVDQMLGALNECTEWGRIAILTAFSEYRTTAADPESVEKAEHICERVVPQFQHANPSVVLMAIRAVIVHLHTLPNDRQEVLKRKMTSPLITLLATPPELQYVALRNIRLILEEFPGILRKEIKVFYCKYNDPLYLKLEKIEILVKLVTDVRASQVISELKEYCAEVDMVFVRRAVRALGQVAIAIESKSDLVVDTLLDLLDRKVPYITQEVAVVMRDILRKYPQFEDAIPKLCDSIEEIDEVESRSAIVWILGEFSDRIPPIVSLISPFVRNFMEESTPVQLQLLSACVKFYIKKPEEGKDIINDLLQQATQKSDNADIRDRAYIYWRVLSSENNLAPKIVLANRPPAVDKNEAVNHQLLGELLPQLSTLASVYYKSPALLDGESKYGVSEVHKRAQEERPDQILRADNLLDLEDDTETVTDGSSSLGPKSDNILSEIFMSGTPTTTTTATTTTTTNSSDPFAGPEFTSTTTKDSALTPSATQDILSLFAPQQPSKPSSEQPAINTPPAQQPQQSSSKNDDDLLGLF